MAELCDLIHMLCLTALRSAVADVMLAGRRGADIVCLMLSLGGVSSILAACTRIFI